MKKKRVDTPTKAEIEILQILWQKGSATVREVHEAIERDTGYTTVLKFLQIMTEKGLVVRKEEGRAHVYQAKATQKQATGDFLRELLDRVFGGSPSRLVMQALQAKNTSREEINEIRRILDELEEG